MLLISLVIWLNNLGTVAIPLSLKVVTSPAMIEPPSVIPIYSLCQVFRKRQKLHY